jgi:NADPH:quinone reductase-like Zn-dependent oxidoreductase
MGVDGKNEPQEDEDLQLKESMPSMFDVLGAKFHGEYINVLEFQSIAENVQHKLRPDDVLIKVSFTDVNPVYLQKLRGNDNMVGRSVEHPPHVPGYGGSGTVVGVGSAIQQDTDTTVAADSWKGQRVCFLADPARMGSYATYVVVDVNCVAKIPPLSQPSRCWPNRDDDSVSVLRDCASIPVAGLTAYESLAKCGLVVTSESAADTKNDDGASSLLVVGASGGVGSWTITLARALNPRLEIIATASNHVQHEWCLSLGADRVIRHEDISSRLKGGREGSVNDIVCLAEPTQDLFGALSEVIKPYGTICLVVAGKSIGSLNLGFCFFKCVDIKTETVFSSIRTKYRNILPAKELASIIGLLASGKIKAPLSPELENGTISESFRDALGINGVLKALSEPTNRRGNFVMKIDL